MCIDRYRDIGLIVYSYNELTGKISGYIHENWTKKEKWCLEKLTLNGNLPLDIIDISVTLKAVQSIKSQKCTEILEITGSRFNKVNPDKGTSFTTRLVSKNGCYSYNTATTEVNERLLEKAGFESHPNCIPYLANSKDGAATHKPDVNFERVEILEVKVDKPNKIQNKLDEGVFKQRVLEEAQRIYEIRRPLLENLAKAEEKLKLVKGYHKKFSTDKTMHLRDMDLGTYEVEAARKQNTRFGLSHRLLVCIDGKQTLVWANSKINGILDAFREGSGDLALEEESDFLVMYDRPLASLTITGRGTNPYGNITVQCTFKILEFVIDSSIPKLRSQTEAQLAKYKSDIADDVVTGNLQIPLMDREHLRPYKEYQNLTILPVGSIHKIMGIGYISHYGMERMVVKLQDSVYQAGEDLQSKVNDLRDSCYIKILKIRSNNKSCVRYGECKIFLYDDYWTAFVDYDKLPMFSNFAGETCIVDVKSVEHKTGKRKILLTEQGEIFKMKRSK